MRSYTETRRSLPSLIGVANGFNQELDAYLGFTVFIDPHLICSSMGKIDDCALLAEFSIVDHHNHTYWCLRASLSPSSQEATGRGQPSGCSSEGSHHWRFCFCGNQAHTKWPDQQKASPLQVKHRGWAGCSRPCCGISPSDQQHKPDDRGRQRKSDSHRSCEACGGRVHVDLDPP